MDLSWTAGNDSPRRTIPAGLISVGAHLVLLWAITGGAQSLPSRPPLSPLRFAGQTFEVDAIGDGEQEEATTPSEGSAPAKEGVPDQPDPEPQAEPTDKPEPEPEPVAKPNPDSVANSDLETPAKPKENEASQPTPQPATKPRPKPIDPFDMALPGEAAPSAPPAHPSDTGNYGAEGETTGVTDIYKAFLHMFPEANRHSDKWKSLPIGDVGRVEFTILLSERARIVSLQIDHGTKPPPPDILVRAVRKTRSSLQFQRLGWEGERRAGAQRLAVSARVMSQGPHPETPDREGTQKHGRYGEGRPDAAFFTYYDGHHVEIELERLGSVTPEE